MSTGRRIKQIINKLSKNGYAGLPENKSVEVYKCAMEEASTYK